MTSYIESETKDGSTIRIEVETAAKGVGFSQAAASGKVTSEGGDAYSQTLGTIRACASGIIGSLQEMEHPPQTASVNFAIKIDAESGAMIARAADNAQFKVSLTWKQDGPDDEKDK